MNAERDEAVRRDEAARDEETVPRDERRGWTARLVVGVFLVLAGVVWILDELTGIEVPWRALVPALLIVVGIALAVGSATGRHGGLIALGIVFIILGVVFLLDRFDVIDLRPGILLPLLLIVAGAAVALSALTPSRD